MNKKKHGNQQIINLTIVVFKLYDCLDYYYLKQILDERKK